MNIDTNTKTTEALQQFEKTVHHYLKELDNFTIEELLWQPGEGEWSLGQMIQHLIQSALYMQLRNVDQCLEGNGEAADTIAEMTGDGKAMFAEGSFPPVRVHVPPSPQYTPVQPESKEQLIRGLNTVVDRMRETLPKLEHAPLHSTVPHPRLGPFNATEWYLLIEMHYRHHLLQLDRLKKAIGASVQ
ncbi:DinB family protein [Paenibacillus sp. FSL K6-1096]|uniref:DinB family protein n=1 Tax=Paenibacillus sp. FSL K6-1096 TaxID=2921460 RepID=UPI0030EF1DDE